MGEAARTDSDMLNHHSMVIPLEFKVSTHLHILAMSS